MSSRCSGRRRGSAPSAGWRLAAKQTEHIALALGQLPVEPSSPRLAHAKLRSWRSRSSASTVLAPARSPRVARTGASVSNPTRVGQGSSRANFVAQSSALQLLQLPCPASARPSAMGAKVACGIPAAETCRPALWPRARLGLLRVPLICGCERPEGEHADPHSGGRHR